MLMPGLERGLRAAVRVIWHYNALEACRAETRVPAHISAFSLPPQFPVFAFFHANGRIRALTPVAAGILPIRVNLVV